MWPEGEWPEIVWPEGVCRGLRAPLLVVLGLAGLGCNAAIGGGVVALAGGAGYFASQCYDQVKVRVRDEKGQKTCHAHVVISSDGSERLLRPCYHASLTEGRYRVSARSEGYVPADVEIAIPERTGACPHYTHTIELTLRRPGQAPAAPTFGPPKQPPAAAEAATPRPPITLPPPIPVAAPAVPAPAAAAAAAPAAPAPAPAAPAPAPTAPPSAAFPPAPAPAPSAPAAPAPPSPPAPP
jgi:hypothetical protein